jgi:indolepyruvate ferredoxin oxidoreductase beta subunit
MMDTINIALCGLGGQGILFMTRILAQAALEKGFNVMGAETHGMAQRGGSVVSHLRLGDVESSLVRTGTAQFLLSLDENEGYRNLPFLARGTGFYVNTDSHHFPREEVKNFLDKREIIHRSVPAGTIAQELGAPLSSNLALLGYFSAFEEDPVTHEEMRKTIERISPDPFRDINLTVFDAGFERGMEERQG